MFNLCISVLFFVLYIVLCTIAALRDRTYYIKLHNVNNGNKISAVVKCRTKKKAYELICVYLRAKSLPYVIDLIENTATYYSNNMILVIDD